jgi:hypothetical protein
MDDLICHEYEWIDFFYAFLFKFDWRDVFIRPMMTVLFIIRRNFMQSSILDINGSGGTLATVDEEASAIR